MFRIEEIAGRKICLAGVGKVFYQDGFPISMSIQKLKELGIEVSIFHVCDELIKHGWQNKTILSKVVEDFSDGAQTLDVELVKKFLFSDYDVQRKMIFDYLFPDNETALTFLKNKMPI